jgi:predicted CopG family antitoxin
MATKQIRIGEDCIAILEKWRHEHESLSDAVRRMGRHLGKHGEDGVK